MEPAAPPKQRSPWFYVLLGCGGFAAISCLGFMVVAGVVGKGCSDIAAGVTDPKKREENTIKMLGAIPPGYQPIAGISVLGMYETAVLVNGTFLPDGGIDTVERGFAYFKIMGNENNKAAKTFFTTDGQDSTTLRQSGINLDIDARDVIKRGNITLEGRKLYYVVSRGNLDMSGGRGGARQELMDVVLFDCPGDELRVGIWTMKDPTPDKATNELDLSGGVGDEAQMAPFFKVMNPCEGK